MSGDGERRMVRLSDVLTQELLDRIVEIGDDPRRVADEVVAPNIAGVNERLGQENDPTFIAHAVCTALRGAGVFREPPVVERIKPDLN